MFLLALAHPGSPGQIVVVVVAEAVAATAGILDVSRSLYSVLQCHDSVSSSIPPANNPCLGSPASLFT